MCILRDVLFETHINYIALVHLHTRVHWRQYLSTVTLNSGGVDFVFLADLLEEKGGIIEAKVGVDSEVCSLHSFQHQILYSQILILIVCVNAR